MQELELRPYLFAKVSCAIFLGDVRVGRGVT